MKELSKEVHNKAVREIKKNKLIYLDSFALKMELPILEAQRVLNVLAERYLAEVKVDEQGKLFYLFKGELKLREELWNVMKLLFKGFLKFFKELFVASTKLAMLGVFISYSVLYIGVLIFGFLFSSLIFASAEEKKIKNSENYEKDSYFSDFWEMLVYTFTLKSFHEENEPRKKETLPFHAKMFSFIFGDEEEEQSFKNELNVLSFAKEYKRLTLSDVVNLTGFLEQDAKKFILSLMVKYDGNILVSDSGIIHYVFENFDFRGVKNSQFSYIWNRKLKEWKMNSNDEDNNTKIIILGIINLLLSGLVTIDFIDVFTNGSFLDFWYGPFSFIVSMFIFIIPIVRFPFNKYKAKKIDQLNYIYYLLNDFSYYLDRDYVDMDETDDDAEVYLFENFKELFTHDFIEGKDVINTTKFHEELKFSSKNKPESIKIYSPDDVDFLNDEF